MDRSNKSTSVVSIDDIFASFESSVASEFENCLEKIESISVATDKSSTKGKNSSSSSSSNRNNNNNGDPQVHFDSESTNQPQDSDSGNSRFRGKLYERAKSFSQSQQEHPTASLSSKGKFQSIVLRTIEGFTDPWEHHHIEKIPAERVRSYRYSSKNKSWHVENSFVKIQSEPFDSGAMRKVYRMKKISQLNLTNWCSVDWRNAPNLVAKCYKNANNEWNPQDRMKCFADVKLQIEAAELATRFNHSQPAPPKQIEVITCFVVEFYDRPGVPVFGCERFIDGTDEFGHGFVKHNSNTGFVDEEEIRQTPQAFSYFSFFASNGDRMVVDVQGVNDLYTDPQIHSMDCRFGNADLGARGMAFFFANARRTPLFDYLLIPIFEVSRRTRQRLHEKHLHSTTAAIEASRAETITKELINSRVGRRRVNALWHPMTEQLQQTVQADVLNIVIDELDKKEIHDSLADAVALAELELSQPEADDSIDWHAEFISSTNRSLTPKHITKELLGGLAKIHFELAALHIQGQFSTEIGEDGDPLPDIPSCIYHLCRSCIYGGIEAALALGKIKLGPMDEVTILTLYLQEFIKIDGNTTKLFSELANLRRKKLLKMATNPRSQFADRHLVRRSSTIDVNHLTMESVEFTVGDEVEANYLRGGFWYVAVIQQVVKGGSSHSDVSGDGEGYVVVKYDEGTVEKLGFEDVRMRRE